MTSRKSDIVLSPRLTAYVTREEGAAELRISPSTWDELVDSGQRPEYLRRMAFLGRATGQRVSDLVKMRPADLAEDGINVRIGKLRDKPHFVY